MVGRCERGWDMHVVAVCCGTCREVHAVRCACGLWRLAKPSWHEVREMFVGHAMTCRGMLCDAFLLRSGGPPGGHARHAY